TCGRFDAQARSPAALVGLLPLTRITGAFPAPHERPAADLSHPRVLDGVGRATLSATNTKSGRSGLRTALILDATRNHRARVNRVYGRPASSSRRGIIGRAASGSSKGRGRPSSSTRRGIIGRASIGSTDGPHPRRVEESSGARQSGLRRVEDSPLPRRGIIGTQSGENRASIGRASRAGRDFAGGGSPEASRRPAPGAPRPEPRHHPGMHEVAIRAEGPLAHAGRPHAYDEALAHHEGKRTLPPI